MTNPGQLLLRATKALDAGRPHVLRQAKKTRDMAGKLGAAAVWLGDHSISANIGDRAWQGSSRHMYSRGLGAPPPGAENDESAWTHLSEHEAGALIEKQAGESFDALDRAQEDLVDRAERWRREVIVLLEPIAQDEHFAFARDGIAELQKRALRYSADRALRSMTPRAFIIDDLDAPIRPPLHLLYLARATAVGHSAAAVRTMIDDLGDMATKMSNRAQLEAPPSGQPEPRHMASGSPRVPSWRTVLVGGLEIAAVFFTFVFGAPIWASAALGAAVLAVTVLRHNLIPRPKVGAVALCAVMAALAGISAEHVRATFFESDHADHRYVVDIPEVDVVRRRMSPSTKAEKLLGGPLVVGDSVLVSCVAKGEGYQWAQLERDGSWVPAGVLRLAPGGARAPTCD